MRMRLFVAAIAIVAVSHSAAGSQPVPSKVEIRDGGWSVRIVVEKGVEVANAELIVRAFHRNTLVDRRLRRGGPPVDDFSARTEADRITQIRRTSREQYGQAKDTYFDPLAYADLLRAEGLYLVGLTYPGGGSGAEYLVGIRAGKVELFLMSHWIA